MINQNNPIFRICSSCCDATTNLQRISGSNLKRLNIYTADNVNQLNDKHILILACDFRNKKQMDVPPEMGKRSH